MPGRFDMGQMPEGFDPADIPQNGQIPEAFVPGNMPPSDRMPEGFDPENMPQGRPEGEKGKGGFDGKLQSQSFTESFSLVQGENQFIVQ